MRGACSASTRIGAGGRALGRGEAVSGGKEGSGGRGRGGEPLVRARTWRGRAVRPGAVARLDFTEVPCGERDAYSGLGLFLNCGLFLRHENTSR
jgi:hypothetical protein